MRNVHPPKAFIESFFTNASVPLAGAFQRLLKVVLHHCGITRAVKRDRAGLQAILPAALAESGVTVNVEVKNSCRGTLPITGIYCDLRRKKKT